MADIGVIGPNGESYEVSYTSATFRGMADEYNAIVESHGTIEDIESFLSHYQKVPAFVHNFFRSKFHFFLNDSSAAAHFMDMVIQDLDSGDKNVSMFVFACGAILSNIYGSAGEIFASNGENDKALRCYQDYELTLLQLKSCNYSDGLLSFRPFNEYSLSDLVNNEITVCSPRVMNDPYDTLLIKWGEFIRQTKGWKKHVEALCDSFESFRIRSFCRLKDVNGSDTISNILMWSHYANDHKGICIKYRFSNKFPKTENRCVIRFKDIIYHRSDVPINLDSHSMNTDVALCTKLDEWSYENEVRLVSYIPDSQTPFLQIPLDEESYIESVYFGYRCPDETIKTVRNALHYNERVVYYRMESDYKDIYKLKAVVY